MGYQEVIFKINPITELNPVLIENFGEIEEIKGISVCTFLEKQKVAERQAIASKAILYNFVSKPKIRIINDKSNPFQKGSSIVLYAKTNKGARLGGDAIGKLGKSSELVGRKAAQNLKKEIESKATVDVHLADMLIPYIALANKSSIYITREITDHISTNIWLIEKILNKGNADFIGLCRPLIREPDLPYKWLKGTGNNTCECISCNGCTGSLLSGSLRCTQKNEKKGN